MLQSKLFYRTQKQNPVEEESVNSRLLTRAGFIDKLAGGIYSFLPLGWRVISKIEKIIREEMDNIGGQELLLPALHPKKFWEKTKRWETMNVLYKLKDYSQREYALGPTHEEIIVPLAKKFIQTYKNLPLSLYQIQTKFRDERRVKSGLLRGKEFIMKDLYSFHKNEKDLDNFYEEVKKSYVRIFNRVGLKNKFYFTYASGGTFSKYSHEFQVPTPFGEDIIYVCRNCHYAVNREIKKETPVCPHCGGKVFKEEKAIEIGNIFKLRTKFSAPFKLYFRDKDGSLKLVTMGCYGIGINRLMGSIVEKNYDRKGIIWPKEVAPYQIHLIEFSKGLAGLKEKAGKLYQLLQKNNFEVLYDDRDNISFGEKLVESDLIGLPYRIIVSKRTLEKNAVEFKKRSEEKGKLVSLNQIVKFLNNLV